MPNYKYKAMNKLGERLIGTFNASSEEAVAEMIKANDYYPLEIKEVTKGIGINLNRKKAVKLKDIAIFCRQFYTMVNAGCAINNTITVLKTQMENKSLRKALSDIDEDIRKGVSLSDSMRNHDKVFPDLLISMVETGELTGNLDSIMLRMSTHYEKENKINNRIKNAMIYPAVIAVVAVVALVFIITFILPTFVSLFTDSGVELPLTTRITLAMSKAMSKYFYIVFPIIIAMVIGIRRYFKTESGKYRWAAMQLKIPVLKKLTRSIIVSRFTRTLATVLSSGITLIQGMDIVSEVVGNKIAMEKLAIAKDQLLKGEVLSDSIREAEIFPAMLSSMISIGEESGALDDILNKTADFYDEELDAQIQAFTALIEPMMIVIMGVVIGFLIISILSPMFSMYNTI